MTTDLKNQILPLPDGRQLGFAVYGVPTGRSIFYFHGSGGSRLEHPLPESLLTQMDIRFIAVDRPGNGLSDFQPHRRLTDCARDIAGLADHLGIRQFYVAGHSAGGPHALACAHQLPGWVLAGALISSAAPMSRPDPFQGMPPLNRLLARSARHFPPLNRFLRWMMRGMVLGDLEKASRRIMGSMPAADKQVLYEPHNLDLFITSVREGFRRGSKGVAQDDTLINREWGFDLSGIQPRIDIWHGQEDVNVPAQAARYLQAALSNTSLHILPGEGHFFLLNRWEQILSTLAG